MDSINIEYHNEHLTVGYNFIEDEKEVTYCGDGSGYPGTPDSVEIKSVSDWHGNDVIDDYDIDSLEDAVLDALNQ